MNIFLKKTEDRSKPNRRDFLVQSTAASLGLTSVINSLAQLKLIGSAAASGAGDYKALVCFFLNGGNDSNNLLIPATSGPARTDYQNGRGVLSITDAEFDYTPANATNGYWNGSSISTSAVSSRITPQNAASAYEPTNRTAGYLSGGLALHPGAYPLKTLFDSDDLAFICNVGTLIGTTSVTRANFNTLPAAAKPPQLFSHSDQQVQWQSSLPDQPFSRGWGGKIADLLAGLNSGDLSMSVSIAGVNSFQVAYDQPAYFMNSAGTVSALSGLTGGSPSTSYGGALRNVNLQPTYSNPQSLPGNKYNPLAALSSGADPLAATNYQHTAAGWRLRAIEQMMALQHASLFDNGYNGAPENARITEGLVGNALAQTLNADASSTMDVHFNNWFPNNLYNPRIPDIASQMRTVARLIAGRSALSNTRQIFFVQLGGWDTHTSQIPGTTVTGHYSLVNQMSRSIRAFKDAMDAIGMWDKVMLFSASDFTRTLTPNKNDATGGSDHAWGGHMFVTGGAVKGRNIYGRFPDLTINGGIDCTGNRGRWIPSTSTDQVFASIAKWFGCADGQIGTVLPNFTRFQADLSTGTLNSKNLNFIDFTV
ncbi:DUF1501 domain-containing protein [Brevifollis gellanilyticus]|uniref:Tat pathway signal protein n=1 Tax=Brevifollis gellanilyticus TaxID=748831 RepID=A0A512MD25_9BACT|nr:DUF1501 domain-containing protein [Brevifollis gellanilyticus]GEP44640.1 hypothetical protein BGE01nite_39310 [Brevifollis gellanilyticus]